MIFKKSKKTTVTDGDVLKLLKIALPAHEYIRCTHLLDQKDFRALDIFLACKSELSLQAIDQVKNSAAPQLLDEWARYADLYTRVSDAYTNILRARVALNEFLLALLKQ